ncbi:MAG: hypothetical protein RLZZ450_1952 [Pseudomonadota bacterium]|jgi:sulfite exporter TauE/SafE
MPPVLVLAVVTGGSLAVASSAHCAVMCGPLALASRVRHGSYAGLSYFVGRLVTYSLLGSLAGGAGRVLLLSPWARVAEASLSWLLASTLAYTAWTLLRGPPRERLAKLGRAPRTSPFGAILARLADEPLLLGAATALLPCAALFTALVAAATLGSAALGALSMATFAVVTGAVVVGVAQLGRLRATWPGVRRVVGVTLLLGALLTAYRPVPMLRADGAVPACHLAGDAPLAARGHR